MRPVNFVLIQIKIVLYPTLPTPCPFAEACRSGSSLFFFQNMYGQCNPSLCTLVLQKFGFANI